MPNPTSRFAPNMTSIIHMITSKTETNDRIIKFWYEGSPRHYIVQETGASAGHVHDVKAGEWQKTGEGNVEALRRLAVAASK